MSTRNPDQGEAVDLFGNLSLPIRDRRGRPSFKKTPENQDFVATRAAAGWSQKRIAEDMGVDEKTLRKNFSRELAGGSMIVEGVMLDVLMKKAREGHTPSIRLLREWIVATAPFKPRQVEDSPDGPDEEVEDKGKKAMRLERAQDAPDDYADLYARRRRPI